LGNSEGDLSVVVANLTVEQCDVPYRDDGGLIDWISENDDVSRLQRRKLTQGELCPIDPGTELERGFFDPVCGGAVCCSVLGGAFPPRTVLEYRLQELTGVTNAEDALARIGRIQVNPEGLDEN
jgi:hypothetical protein